MKAFEISTLDSAFIEETMVLAYSLELYQLINAFSGVATAFAEQLHPGANEETHFRRAMILMRQGMDATLSDPDIWSELLTGTGNNDDIGHRPGGGR